MTTIQFRFLAHLFVVLTGVLLVSPTANAARIQITQVARVGTPVPISVIDDDGSPLIGVAVSIVSAPGSEAAQIQELGTTDSHGRMEWTPARAGLAELRAFGTTRGVAVRFASTPWVGWSVFALASLALFGGSGFGLRRILAPAENRLQSQLK